MQSFATLAVSHSLTNIFSNDVNLNFKNLLWCKGMFNLYFNLFIENHKINYMSNKAQVCLPKSLFLTYFMKTLHINFEELL